MTTAPDLDRPILTVVPEGEVAVEELGSQIVGLAGRLAAATCRWLLLVAAFDARAGYRHYVLHSTARWLAHYCGVSRRTAIEHVRVARALAAHPSLAAAMSAGRMSYSHVRAISRIADLGDTALVESLVTVAEHGTVSQLEDVVRGLRTVDDHQQPDAEPPREHLTRRWRDDSTLSVSARLDPENGALVQSAIEAVAQREGITEAQALTRMAEIALDVIAAETGELPSLRGHEHAAVVVHLDASAVPGEPDADGPLRSAERDVLPPRRPYARIARGPGLPERVVQRLLCLGRIRTVAYDADHHPLDVGRSRRVVTTRQLTALLLRDGGCRHPGCSNRRHLEAHHVLSWLSGGRTSLDNLVLLCRAHHHALHDGELRIVALGNQRFRFELPDGTELTQRTELNASPDAIEDEHPDVEPGAATTRWDGSRLDHDYAVAALAQNLTSTRRLSA